MFKFIFINNFNLFPKLPSFYTLLRSLMCKKRELKFGGSSLDFGCLMWNDTKEIGDVKNQLTMISQ